MAPGTRSIEWQIRSVGLISFKDLTKRSFQVYSRRRACSCLVSVSATEPMVIFDSRNQLSTTAWSSVESGRSCGLRNVGNPWVDLNGIGRDEVAQSLVGDCLWGVLGAFISRFIRRSSVEVRFIAAKAGTLSKPLSSSASNRSSRSEDPSGITPSLWSSWLTISLSLFPGPGENHTRPILRPAYQSRPPPTASPIRQAMVHLLAPYQWIWQPCHGLPA